MATWQERQTIELRRCLESFEAQFKCWEDRTARPPWETHYSQVRAAAGLLSGLREKLRDALKKGASQDLELRVLSAWRVWEAFRSRLAQRQEEDFREGLCAADEIAWACRKPVVEAFKKAGKSSPKEPPLAYLSGSVSPVALARDRVFAEEPVFGEPLWKAARGLLDRLPVPFIGLPWHEVFHAPGSVAIAHETGHVVEADFQLTAALDAAMAGACAAAGKPEHVEAWKRWRAEVFADHFAIRACGPMYVAMLADLLAPRAAEPPAETYPPHAVRAELCFQTLDALGLTDEAAAARDEWSKRVPAEENEHLATVPQIVEKLGAVKLGHQPVTTVLPFTLETHGLIREVADELRRGGNPPAGTGAHLIAAAAAHLFREEPQFFDNADATEEIWSQILRQEGAGSRRRAGRKRDIARAVARGGRPATDIFQRHYTAGKKLAAQWLNEPLH